MFNNYLNENTSNLLNIETESFKNEINKNKNERIIQNVLKCVMILLGKSITHIAIYTEVGKPDFLSHVRNYDIN